jgi:hypothetical protein
MAKFIGRQQEVGVAVEATRGTPVVPTFWIPKMNYNVEDKVLKAVFEGNYGVLAGGDDALVTSKWAEGDLEFEMQDKVLPYVLYSLFGSLSSASFNSVYKHTLALGTTVQGKTLTLWMNDPINAAESPTKSLAYAKAAVNNFELSAVLGELVKCRANFIAMLHKDFTR